VDAYTREMLDHREQPVYYADQSFGAAATATSLPQDQGQNGGSRAFRLAVRRHDP
jgi:hypothetical protein